MLFPIGLLVVFGSVAFGYGAHGGNFKILWQPLEMVIIFGAAIGAFLISNPMIVIKDVLGNFKKLTKGIPFNKEDYTELLGFLFNICKIMKTKGMLEVEPALDNPHESEIFTKYPRVLHNHHGVTFFCDYVRIITMGMDNHYQMEDLMNQEIDDELHEKSLATGAVSTIADGMPALGIVAAVLGVITTMGSITEPPEILGGLIGAALVGTFLGVLMAYGVIGPIASSMGKFSEAEVLYMKVIKAAILAHMQGNAPQVTVEFARKAVPGHFRPTFEEIDNIINNVTKE